MLEQDQSRHDFAFLAGAVIGAVSGALATLALTPMSGSEVREKIRARAGDLGPVKEKAASLAATGKEKATSLAATGKERASGLAATGKEKAQELAAKSPLPIGGTPAESSAGADIQVDGFGAHAEQAAEGARDASTLSAPS
jgi:gas vesicle protein